MITPVRYLVLGAGPSGLTLAHRLLQGGVPRDQVLVLEAAGEPGGLCRSAMVDGKPLDIGGGHFLDVRNQSVMDYVFQFMPKTEWDTYQRVAKIALRGLEIDHPLEGNLWQLTKDDQVDYLDSIARTGSVIGKVMPENFEEWVYWKLGDKIAKDYMLPYNRKLWSMSPDRLGTYWLNKLPDVSFRDSLRSCLEQKAFGTLPAHGVFLYPKTCGYGELWKRMGMALGPSLRTNSPVTKIDVGRRIVNDLFQAESIINTIPWTLWPRMSELPTHIVTQIHKLEHVPIDVDYCPENLDTTAHWIYEPREEIPYHRMLVRHNFCPGSRGYWTETNSSRNAGRARCFRHRNEFAYPVNTREKPGAIADVVAWAKTKHIVGMGRWGLWEHMNSDVAVANGLALAQALLSGKEA